MKILNFLKKPTPNPDLVSLKSTLKNSFQNLKSDIQNIQSWINYLQQNQQKTSTQINQNLAYQNQYFLHFQNQINILNQNLKNFHLQQQMPVIEKQHIKQAIDYYYDFEHLISRIQALESEKKTSNNEQILSEINILKGRLEQLENKKITPKQHYEPVQFQPIQQQTAPRKTQAMLREKIIKQLTSKSKEYVKNFILSLITKYGEISALKLREIVMDEQGLCSKSSFYRILGEIEKESHISSIRKGREKLYTLEKTTLN